MELLYKHAHSLLYLVQLEKAEKRTRDTAPSYVRPRILLNDIHPKFQEYQSVLSVRAVNKAPQKRKGLGLASYPMAILHMTSLLFCHALIMCMV